MLGLRALNVIVINLQLKLPGAESAQVIFESINATDAQFKDAFVKYNFYKNYGRYVQEKLAQESGNDKHIMFESIEHILPQTLDPSKWPNFHTETLNDLYGLENANDVYGYLIVLEDGVRWDHVV